MKGINVFFGIAFCPMLFNFAVSLEVAWSEWGSQLKKDVSFETYSTMQMLSENPNIRINNETLETFEQILKAFDGDYVQRHYDDVPLNTRRTFKQKDYFWKWENFNHWFSHWPAMYVCLAQTSLARGAVASLRRYYNIRTLYTYDFEYEVGYLAYDMIHHYTALLELMKMIQYRYVKFRLRRSLEDEQANLAPVRYMWFVYRNMVELSRKIIFQADLLYGLKDKHKNVYSVYGAVSPFLAHALDANESVQFKRWHDSKSRYGGFGGFGGFGGGKGAGSIGGGLEALPPEEREHAMKKMLSMQRKEQMKGLATKAPVKRGSNKSWFHIYHYGWSLEYPEPKKEEGWNIFTILFHIFTFGIFG